jgi:biotin carboxylase
VTLPKTILIVGGGIEAVEGVRVAHALGLRVLVLDRNTKAPARALADGFVEADVYDPELAAVATAKFARSWPIDGVIALAVDAPLTVAHIAAAIGIPGPSLETAELASDKMRMKQRFAERGVPIPWFSAIDSVEHLRRTVASSPSSLVLKPVDSRGSRGVLRLDASVDLAWAFEHSRSFSRSRRVMVEEWIHGPQISTESVVFDGESVLCGTGDRNYGRLDEVSPFVVEDGGNCPSRYSPARDADFDRVMRDAAAAIGLERGTIKGDIVVGDRGVVVIEVAARLSGGYFSTHTIPVVYGRDLIGAAMQIALGLRPDVEELRAAQIRAYQANRFFFLPEGIVTAVNNVDRVAGYPWVKMLEVYVAPGVSTGKVSDHTRRGGTVMTMGESAQDAEERVERAIAEIQIVVQ